MTSIPQNNNRFLTIAPNEAKQGRAVFPCRGKFPAISKVDGGHGCEDATTDEAIIQEWAKLFPDANVGITFRYSSLEIGLDVDTENLDKFQALAKEHGQEKFNTRAVRTGGGGYHFYFLRPQGVTLRNIPKDEGLGFELKSNNQYLIAPGSIHPKTGKEYRLIADTPCEPLPGWIVALATAPSTKTQTLQQPHKTIKKLTNAWHSELIGHIGRMRAKGLAEDEITTLALALNHDSGNDPLPDAEVITMVKEYEKQSKVDAEGIPLDQYLTDVGNAERLINQFGHKLRYSFDRVSWLVYNGHYWEWDSGENILTMAQATARAIYHEAAETPDKKLQDDIAKHAKQSQSNMRIKGMIEQAKSKCAVSIESLDADGFLLNVKNGTINLRTGDLQPHNPNDLITRMIPIEYEPTAVSQEWDSFLTKIFDGKTDLIRYNQKAYGYAITESQDEQAFFFNKGGGSNGKTTLTGAVMDVLGDYATEIDPLAFMVDKNAKVGPNEAIASLYKKRLVCATEIKTGLRLNVALIKRMTGGEALRFERKFEHGFNFKPTHKLFMSGNHEPRIDDTTNSIWNRLKYIPFNVTITENERIRGYQQILVKNHGQAILNWLVQGCLLWQKEGLAEPREVKQAIQTYRDTQDVLHDFIEEKCLEGVNETILVSEIFKTYKTWATENDIAAIGKNTFNERLRERGYVVRPGHGNKKYWHGIRLLLPDEKVTLQSQMVTFDTPISKSSIAKNDDYAHNENFSNKINQSNQDTAEPSTELPNCQCGKWDWIQPSKDYWQCRSCGHEIPIEGGIR